MFEAKTDLKTAIFFADGCEEIEGLTVVDLLYRAGIPCTKVSINDVPEVTSSHEITFRTDTTIAELKQRVHELCLRKGWGKDGVQNPQQVAMAMTVEMSELLEHFQWLNPEDVQRLTEGKDPERVALIAEEFADVMMYGLQLARTLGIDVTQQILRKIDIVDHRQPKPYNPKR